VLVQHLTGPMGPHSATERQLLKSGVAVVSPHAVCAMPPASPTPAAAPSLAVAASLPAPLSIPACPLLPPAAASMRALASTRASLPPWPFGPSRPGRAQAVARQATNKTAERPAFCIPVVQPARITPRRQARRFEACGRPIRRSRDISIAVGSGLGIARVRLRSPEIARCRRRRVALPDPGPDDR
jgi:hypothetical protein